MIQTRNQNYGKVNSLLSEVILVGQRVPSKGQALFNQESKELDSRVPSERGGLCLRDQWVRLGPLPAARVQAIQQPPRRFGILKCSQLQGSPGVSLDRKETRPGDPQECHCYSGQGWPANLQGHNPTGV